VIFIKDGIIFPVPKHPGRDISPGVEKKIISLVGLTSEEFKNLKK
jgi:predicted RNA binding protein YcfA (HicA-like mRNA interferase family)